MRPQHRLLTEILIVTCILCTVPFIIEAKAQTQESELSFSARIVYIHDGNLTAANAYQAMLTGWGYVVDLVDVNDLSTGYWNAYDLMIIAHETGTTMSFDNASMVPFLDGIGIPIIGIGLGGLQFYDDLGTISLVYGYSMVFSGQNITVKLPTHPVASYPNTIASGPAFQSSQTCHGLYIPHLNASAESIVVGSVQSNYALCAVEGRYAYWGFHDGMDWKSITSDLFQNLVVYLLPGDGYPFAKRLVYIHDGNLTAANAYQAMLTGWGYVVDLVDVNDLSTGYWNAYDLMIIAHETGTTMSFDNASMVPFLDGIGIPIIGIGLGGLQFYDDLGTISLVYGYSMVFSGQNITVKLPTHPVASYPNTIASGPAFQSSQTCHGLYIPHLNASAESIVVGSVQSNYALCAVEGRYAYWGFHDGMDWKSITSDLFQNLVVYLAPHVVSSGGDTIPPADNTIYVVLIAALAVAAAALIVGMLLMVKKVRKAPRA